MNKKFIFLFSSLFVFIFSFNHSFAYEADSTHKDLTKKIVEIYNKYNEVKITDEQANWIIQGTVEEDIVPRWINHFYDPIYKAGWSGEKQGDIPQDTVQKLSKIFISPKNAVSSLDWLHNQNLQENYGFYEGNQTYDRAVENYAWAVNLKNNSVDNVPSYANFENAFKALGHTLHLLEDLGVPAHTRNDTHADVSITKDTGDPYEKWAAKSGNDNLSALNNLKVSELNFNCQIIDDCFVNLARYTNENFYSKDTINEQKYKLPAIAGKIKKDNIAIYFDSNNNPLVIKNYDNGEYTIEDNQIHQAYWNLLSKQIVLAGVQALKIFYQNDAPKQIENLQYKTSFANCDIPGICGKNKIISPFAEFTKITSAIGKFIGNVTDTTKDVIAKTGGFIKGIFGTDNLNQITEVDLSGQNSGSNTVTNNNVNTTKQNKTANKPDQAQALKEEISSLKKEIGLLNKELNNKDKNQTNNEAATSTVNDVAVKTVKAPVVEFCKFSTSQKPSHSGVVINEIAWMGSVKSSADEWIELKNISDQQIDLSGWQLISKDGQIKINLSELKNANSQIGSYILLERTDDNTVLGIFADLIYKGGLSNADEKLRLFDSGCNLIDEISAGAKWSAGDSATKKTMERNTDVSYQGSSNKFGWHTSSVIGGTPKAQNSDQIVYSGGGGGGGSVSSLNNTTQATTQQTAQSQNYNVAINEIIYSLDGEDTGREWIEILNNETSAVDISVLKLSEGGTNHGLTLKQGEKNLVSNGFAIISNDAGKFLTDYPNYSGTIFESAFSLSNTGEIIALKNDNLNLDEVDYKADWGADGNGKSLQLISGNWKESSPTPGAENKLDVSQTVATSTAISAQFSFSPAEPKEGEEVIFNAASSTAEGDNIFLYEWQFGDNIGATSTEFQISHTFQTVGVYVVNLTVYAGNASSTTSLVANIFAKNAEQSAVNHIVISEIMPSAGTGRSDEEFVELYNPTEFQIDLTGYFLERKSSFAATSTQTLVESANFKNKIVPSKGFLLIASEEYNANNKNKLSDVNYSHSYRLANSDDAVILYNGADIVDQVDYSSIDSGKSFERKSFSENSCISSQGVGEFLGDGCDTDSGVNDFEIRDISNPQNSASLPEPRNTPSQIQNFGVQYNSSGPSLVFDWQASVDYQGKSENLKYGISDISDIGAGEILSDINTTSTSAGIGINEVGRVGENNYKFSIRAFDADGLGSVTSTVSMDVTSFVSSLHIFKISNDLQGDYVEADYDKYPFVPKRYDVPATWRMIVFYINQDALKTQNYDDYSDWGHDIPNTIKLGYETCAGQAPVTRSSLILPDSSESCATLGKGRSSALKMENLEDMHFLVKFDQSMPRLKVDDYVTAAFYAYDGNNNMTLVAVDKEKYFYRENIDWQKSPKFVDGSQLKLNFDKASSKLVVSWPMATDEDSIDKLITYKIQYSENGEWQSIKANNAEKIVSPGDSFLIKVKAEDEFGNSDLNQILSASWVYPETIFSITQTNTNGWSYDFGYASVSTDYGDVASLQSIVPADSFQFNKVVLRLWQTMANNNGNLRLRVYNDNNGKPGGSVLGEAGVNNLFNPDKNSDIAFSFNSPISVVSGNKYWLILDVSNFDYMNYWKIAISADNNYPNGDAGRCFDICFGTGTGAGYPYFDVPSPSGADWYMKIGME